MTTLLRTLPLAALTLLAASPLSAQSIDGTWITEFDRMMRNESGAVTTGEKSKAKMTLVQKGDSVTGTWLAFDAPRGGGAPTPRELKGTITGNKVRVEAKFQATVNMNGETSTRDITVVYDFSVNGDKLEGTFVNRSADMDMPARPFTAWKEKAEKQ